MLRNEYDFSNAWKVEHHNRPTGSLIVFRYNENAMGSIVLNSQIITEEQLGKIENILNEKPIENIVRTN